MKFADWFPQIKGLKLSDEEGKIYKVVTYSMPCDNIDWLQIGLEGEDNIVRYCTLNRYMELFDVPSDTPMAEEYYGG